MKRARTQRERVILTCLPMMAVAAFYVFVSLAAQRATLADAESRIAAMQHGGVAQAQIAARRQLVREYESQIAGLKRERAHRTDGDGLLAAHHIDNGAEPLAVARITRIFSTHGVVVTEAHRLMPKEAEHVSSDGVVEMLERAVRSKEGDGHGVWKLELIGSFTGVQQSVAAVVAMDGMIVPLNLEMQSLADGGSLHRWVIWVWV